VEIRFGPGVRIGLAAVEVDHTFQRDVFAFEGKRQARTSAAACISLIE
jgi:hypothetical protein